MIKKLCDIPQDIMDEVDWEMTPEEAIAKHLEWGPLRSQSMYESKYGDNVTIYFVINTWGKEEKLQLVKRKGFDSWDLGQFDIPDDMLTDFQLKYKGVFDLTKNQIAYIMKETNK